MAIPATSTAVSSLDKPASTATAANISTEAEATTAINLMVLARILDALLPVIAALRYEVALHDSLDTQPPDCSGNGIGRFDKDEINLYTQSIYGFRVFVIGCLATHPISLSR